MIAGERAAYFEVFVPTPRINKRRIIKITMDEPLTNKKGTFDVDLKDQKILKENVNTLTSNP